MTVEAKRSGELDELLGELLAVRGATVAALVDGAGDLLASRAHDAVALARAAGLTTTALAAATALGGLLPDDAPDGRPSQVMVNLDTGPLLFVPLADTDRVVVVGVQGDADLGRARLAVKGRLRRFEDLARSTVHA